jgi:ABC-type thiamine transport system ATPase subunit
MPKGEAKEKVEWAARILGVSSGCCSGEPRQLSGGERQRVALCAGDGQGAGGDAAR